MSRRQEVKNKGGRPRVNTEPVTLRLSRDMIRAIDNERRQQDDLPTRPEVIRRLLEKALMKERS
jgi:Arc/MetJ-type ribon-helix-helix transcriptional regulator